MNTTFLFRVPLVAKIGIRGTKWPPPLEFSGAYGDNLTKFKLLNVILALMDWNVIIDHNTQIPVHKLGQNYV